MAYVDAATALKGRPRDAGAESAEFQPQRVPKSGGGLVSALVSFVLDHPYLIYAFLRRFMPIAVFGNWAFISRYDDVQEVLKRQADFPVPFGPKIEVLNDGPNFLLGMQDGPEYRAVHATVAKVFPTADNRTVIAPLAADIAGGLVAASGGRIDAVQDLITLTPTRICEQYYGVGVPDERRFAHITICMSTFMFGDPTDDPVVREEALKAGQELRPIIDAAISKARAGGADDATIAGRLVRAADDAGPLRDPQIRAILVGMITGFVPTNTMAGGHMLEMLLRRPDMMREAQAAARADDDELLKRCLWEAFRFMPLNPGPFRSVAADTVVAKGTPRARRLRKDMKLLVGTHPAMFDPRRVLRPGAFDPDRNPNDNMTFGFGLHWCIGAPLAEAQITQTLKPLLQKQNLRRAAGPAGRLAKDGPFPAHLVVEFDAD